MLLNKSKTDDLTLKWFPFYTRSRFEKKSYDNLIKSGFEVYLPMQQKLRQWSDRKKMVAMPLFSSYIFVRTLNNRLFDVLNVNGIVRYISFNGQPAIIRDSEIELIRKLLSSNTEIEVVDGKIETGTELLLTSGAFQGYKGKVVQLKNKNKVVIEIASISKSILVTVDLNTAENLINQGK